MKISIVSNTSMRFVGAVCLFPLIFSPAHSPSTFCTVSKPVGTCCTGTDYIAQQQPGIWCMALYDELKAGGSDASLRNSMGRSPIACALAWQVPSLTSYSILR